MHNSKLIVIQQNSSKLLSFKVCTNLTHDFLSWILLLAEYVEIVLDLEYDLYASFSPTHAYTVMLWPLVALYQTV